VLKTGFIIYAQFSNIIIWQKHSVRWTARCIIISRWTLNTQMKTYFFRAIRNTAICSEKYDKQFENNINSTRTQLIHYQKHHQFLYIYFKISCYTSRVVGSNGFFFESCKSIIYFYTFGITSNRTLNFKKTVNYYVNKFIIQGYSKWFIRFKMAIKWYKTYQNLMV